MQRLREMRIWLDHIGPDTWSKVNERTVLACLEPLHNITTLDISVNLPKIHPKYETPERNFTSKSPPSILPIVRQYRHRYHSTDGIDAQYSPDFPILHDLVMYGWIEDDDYIWTMDEVEKMERDEIAAGRDPREILRILQPHCTLGII